MITDKKFRPDDEGIYTEEKQEFQGSQTRKKEESAAYETVSPLSDERDETDDSGDGDGDSGSDSSSDSNSHSGGDGGGDGGGGD